jgi:hypothetical protein
MTSTQTAEKESWREAPYNVSGSMASTARSAAKRAFSTSPRRSRTIAPMIRRLMIAARATGGSNPHTPAYPRMSEAVIAIRMVREIGAKPSRKAAATASTPTFSPDTASR